MDQYNENTFTCMVADCRKDRVLIPFALTKVGLPALKASHVVGPCGHEYDLRIEITSGDWTQFAIHHKRVK